MKEENIFDAVGKDLQIGDWVKVISVPLSIQNMPAETKEAFSSAVGHTFQIEDIHEYGDLELSLWPKISFDTIWIEPYCTIRFRRYRQWSKRFQKIMAFRQELEQPQYILKYAMTYKAQYSIERVLEEFDVIICDLLVGHGFSYNTHEKTITGTLSVSVHHHDGIERLKKAKDILAHSPVFEAISLGEITQEELMDS